MPSVLMGLYGLRLVIHVNSCVLLPAYAFCAQQGSLAGRALHHMTIPAQCNQMPSLLTSMYGLHLVFHMKSCVLLTAYGFRAQQGSE